MPAVTIAPLADYLTVRLEPIPRRSRILETVEDLHTSSRWARIQALGPRVRELQEGQRVLISVHQGIAISNCLLIPYASVLLTE